MVPAKAPAPEFPRFGASMGFETPSYITTGSPPTIPGWWVFTTIQEFIDGIPVDIKKNSLVREPRLSNFLEILFTESCIATRFIQSLFKGLWVLEHKFPVVCETTDNLEGFTFQ